MPKTDLAEAAARLDPLSKALDDIVPYCSATTYELTTVDGPASARYAKRKNRLSSLCSHAALTIEHSVKCLTALGGVHPKHSHNIAALLDACPEVPAEILDALEPLRVNTLREPEYAINEYDDISCWRTLGTYTSMVERPELASFAQLAHKLTEAALLSTGTTLERLVESGIDPAEEQFVLCSISLEQAREAVATHDIVRGIPNSPQTTKPVSKWKRWFRRSEPDRGKSSTSQDVDHLSSAISAPNALKAPTVCNKETSRGSRCQRTVAPGKRCPDHD